MPHTRGRNHGAKFLNQTMRATGCGVLAQKALDPLTTLLVEEQEVTLSRLPDLDLMIANGWGDTPQRKLPEDWRTRRNETTH